MEEPGVDTTEEVAEPDRDPPELVTTAPEAVLAVSEVDKTMLVEPESLPLPVVEVRPEEDWTERREIAMAKTMSLCACLLL